MRQLDHGITLLKWAIIGFDILIFVVYLFFADKVFAPSVPMMAGRNSLFLLYIGLISILSAEFLSTPVVYSFSATPSMIILRTMKLCSVQWLVFFILLWTGSLWLHPLLGSVIFSVGFLIILLLVRMAEYGLIHSRIASSRSAGKSVIVGDASVMPILLDILKKQSFSSRGTIPTVISRMRRSGSGRRATWLVSCRRSGRTGTRRSMTMCSARSRGRWTRRSRRC